MSYIKIIMNIILKHFMKKIISFYLINLILFVSFGELAAQGSTVKIMPIGDSITQLNGDYDSYRRPLWHSLNSAGYNVDFVGSLNSNYPDVSPPDPDFDLDHEGHWGQRADEILVNIEGWASTYQPDIALIHLGTNDLIQGQSISTTIAEIRQIIDELRDAKSDIHIYLAKLIPTTKNGIQNDIIDFNNQIPGLANSKNTAQSPIVVVDQWSGFDVNDDTFDTIHPDESGENKMASQWYTSLLNDSSLPVSFSSFNAEIVNNAVFLKWRTESEFQNLGFEIYRSMNKITGYELISSYNTNQDLVGSNSSVDLKSYFYKDGFVQPGFEYWYKIVDVNVHGIKTEHGPFHVLVTEQIVPESITLYSNYPNPFSARENPSTNILFYVPNNKMINEEASLVVYNSLGRIVKTLYLGNIQPGKYTYTWDGRDENQIVLPSGNYYANLRIGNYSKTIKMIWSR